MCAILFYVSYYVHEFSLAMHISLQTLINEIAEEKYYCENYESFV